MYKFKGSLIALIGLVSLVAIATVTTPRLSYGSNGPTAFAAPSQTQNVNVVNTPTVKIDSTNPVMLHDVDNAALQPFQASASGNFVDGAFGTGSVPITQVPVGKRLIIEHVSVHGATSPGQKLMLASIGVTQQNANGGQPIFHYLIIHPAGSDGFADRYYCGEAVRLYADPGTIVSLLAIRDSTAGTLFGAVQYSISGYFINMP
jgi:hypothetical protein